MRTAAAALLLALLPPCVTCPVEHAHVPEASTAGCTSPTADLGTPCVEEMRASPAVPTIAVDVNIVEPPIVPQQFRESRLRYRQLTDRSGAHRAHSPPLYLLGANFLL